MPDWRFASSEERRTGEFRTKFEKILGYYSAVVYGINGGVCSLLRVTLTESCEHRRTVLRGSQSGSSVELSHAQGFTME